MFTDEDFDRGVHYVRYKPRESETRIRDIRVTVFT